MTRGRLVAVVAVLLCLPLLTRYMWICLTYYDGALVPVTSSADLARLASDVPPPTRTAVLLYGGWLLHLVWVPFTYTIQAYYLVTHPHELSAPATIGIVALNMTGYFIFRSVNIQKHRFRRDPTRAVWGRPPEYIRTTTGSLLLTSGWWGVARHLNYRRSYDGSGVVPPLRVRASAAVLLHRVFPHPADSP